MPRLVFLVSAALFLALPATAPGQAPPLSISVDGGAPRVVLGQVLHERALEDALRSGLPLRLELRLELWRDRLFDELVDHMTFTRVLAFEPLEGIYLIGGGDDNEPASYPSYAHARAAIETVYRPVLRPSRPGRYYYLVSLEIETLSQSDLEELGQWLRGDMAPAVQGRRSVGGALATGMRRLLIRVLDLPARRYQATSERFTIR